VRSTRDKVRADLVNLRGDRLGRQPAWRPWTCVRGVLLVPLQELIDELILLILQLRAVLPHVRLRHGSGGEGGDADEVVTVGVG
jgi:hypothetical protein